jgi:ribosome-binding factor A
MSRLHRINELILRELSDQLHTRFRDRAVGITFTEVDIMPDLRAARVYYSVLGNALERTEADALLNEIKMELRDRVFKRVILKYTPVLSFHYDDSQVRGNRTLAILDELDTKGEFKNQPPPDSAPED